MAIEIINQKKAVELLRKGRTITDYQIHFNEDKVEALDAFLLRKNGIPLPDHLVFYDDEHIDFEDDADISTEDMANEKLVRLLRAEVVIDEEINEDDKIQYDPDFDEVTWGKPVPFKQMKEQLTAELVVKLQIKNTDMNQWLVQNREQINLVISGLIESMYEAERLPKS